MKVGSYAPRTGLDNQPHTTVYTGCYALSTNDGQAISHDRGLYYNTEADTLEYQAKDANISIKKHTLFSNKIKQ